MNLLTAILLTSALAAGEPGQATGDQSPSPGAAKAKSPAAKPAGSARPSAKKPGGGSSLDDDLFSDLAGDLFEGLEKPKLDKPKAEKQPVQKQESEKPQPEKPEPGKAARPDDPPPEEFPPGEDLGQESNPLLDLGQRMRRAQSLISEGSTGDKTQRLQGDIIKDLDKLIKLTSQT
jgi:hypothetical protein